MIKNTLAVIGLAVLTHKAYQHYLNYQKLLAENKCLRQRWKEAMAARQR
ncbi:hypothetical protein JHL22_15305 [Advenella sp. WQ 585]|uniref:Uncharacterized protein n=1 Tax=Advenella mandrilli TaxID=2800330 RepID=A0ABS1EHW0_9BURK|nr:hypothetical protein [Advenella mandrilli]MBK1782579.1 hypothetical protein [Advenella mandrilli]